MAVRAVVLDLDGTLIDRRQRPVPGVPEMIATLRTMGMHLAAASNPTTPLSLALCFSALTMCKIRLVIAPLEPGHKGEALLNRIRM
jgi:FMN phosphatase YigB (HAD superfamily)